MDSTNTTTTSELHGQWMQYFERLVSSTLNNYETELSSIQTISNLISQAEIEFDVKVGNQSIVQDNNIIEVNFGGKCVTVDRNIICNPAIKYNFFSVLFHPRWEKALPRDREGRIYFDWDYKWIEPILSAFDTAAFISTEDTREKILFLDFISDQVKQTQLGTNLLCTHLGCGSEEQSKQQVNESGFPTSLPQTVVDRIKKWIKDSLQVSATDTIELNLIPELSENIKMKPQTTQVALSFNPLSRQSFGVLWSNCPVRHFRPGESFHAFCRIQWHTDYDMQFIGSGYCSNHNICGIPLMKVLPNQIKLYNPQQIRKFAFLNIPPSNGPNGNYNSRVICEYDSQLAFPKEIAEGRLAVTSMQLREFYRFEVLIKPRTAYDESTVIESTMIGSTIGSFLSPPITSNDPESTIQTHVVAFNNAIDQSKVNLKQQRHAVTKRLDTLIREAEVIKQVISGDCFISHKSDSRDIAAGDNKDDINDKLDTLYQRLNDLTTLASSQMQQQKTADIVTFNVRGTIVSVLKSTIQQSIPNSQLAIRFNGEWKEQETDLDSNGYVIVNYPSSVFIPFINFLRTKRYFSTEANVNTIRYGTHGLAQIAMEMLRYYAVDSLQVNVE